MNHWWRRSRIPLFLVFALTLAACGGSADDGTPEAEPTEATSESTTTDAAGETITSDALETTTTEPPATSSTASSTTASSTTAPPNTAAPDTKATNTEPSNTEPPNTEPPNTVANLELVSDGEEPRFEIRFEPAAGDVFLATLTQSQDLSTSVEGGPPNEVLVFSEIDVRFEVVRSDSDGFTMVTSYEDIRVDPDRTRPADAVSQIELGMLGLLEVTFESSFTPLGEIVDVASLTESSNPAIQALAEQQIESSRSISIAAPSVPVGVGANWIVSDEIMAGGIPATIRFSSTVTEISEDRATTDVVISTTFPPGEQSVQGTLFEVVAGAFADGRGTTTYLRSSPTSEFEIESTSEITLLVGEEKSKLVQSVSANQSQKLR